jgi:hypothetical protein
MISYFHKFDSPVHFQSFKVSVLYLDRMTKILLCIDRMAKILSMDLRLNN